MAKQKKVAPKAPKKATKKAPPKAPKKATKKARKKQVVLRDVGPPRIVLQRYDPNPDFPHDQDVDISGTVVGSDNMGIAATLKREGLADVVLAVAAVLGTSDFTIRVPKDTLLDGFDNYILKATKAGVLPDSMILDTQA